MLVTSENLTAENCRKAIEENSPARIAKSTSQLLTLIHQRICQYVNEEGIICDLIINLSTLCARNGMKIPSSKENIYICKELEGRGFRVKLVEESSNEDPGFNYNLYIQW